MDQHEAPPARCLPHHCQADRCSAKARGELESFVPIADPDEMIEAYKTGVVLASVGLWLVERLSRVV